MTVKEAKQIVQIMESSVELEVPNKVDYEAGENWGNINQEELWKQLNKSGKITEKFVSVQVWQLLF